MCTRRQMRAVLCLRCTLVFEQHSCISFSTSGNPQSCRQLEHLSPSQELTTSSSNTSLTERTIDPIVAEKSETTSADGKEYPEGFKLVSVCVALCMSVFLVALDNTIITTAIPRITDRSNSLDDMTWYGSAYLLTTSSFTLFFGRLYTLFDLKIVLISTISVFEIGSLICGVAPSSTASICGRAIAGMESVGIFSGALLIIAHSLPMDKRAVYTGTVSSMYDLASVCGPLIGGAFTDHVSWRWCFYINSPIDAVAVAVILFFFQSPPPPGRKEGMDNFIAVFKELDIIGTFFFIPSVVCPLLALQFGGSQYAWSDGQIITYFVVFGICLVIWLGIRLWRPERASVNPKSLKQRTIASCSWYIFTLGGALFTLLYYLPLWFQAIKGVSALQSGIDNIPLVLAVVTATISSGILVTIIGHYVPFMIGSTIFMPIGIGLITTFESGTSSAKWIGYQIICGIGIGLGMQKALIAGQIVVEMAKVPTIIAMLVFFQAFGAALFVSVGQSVFQVYNDTLGQTFIVALALACLTVFGVVAIEWKSVKGKELAMG